MDEVAIAKVNAYVTKGPAHGVEEHKITGLELTFVNNVGTGRLVPGAARKYQPGSLFINCQYKTAAIKTGVCAGAASAVTHAHKTHRGGNQRRRVVYHLARLLRYCVAHVWG